jgi:AcrR family transcriptional regulator
VPPTPKARDNRTRTLSKAERYDEILAAAAKVFAEHGYRRSNIHDIAGELGITAAALYHYTPSKQEMLADICMRAGTQLHEGVKAVIALDLAPEETLKALFHHHLRLVESNRAIFVILTQERSELPAERLDEFLAGERAYFTTIRKLLKQLAGPDYEIPEPPIAALAMLGMLNWVLRWYRADGAYDLDDIADELFRIFHRGILGRNAADLAG